MEVRAGAAGESWKGIATQKFWQSSRASALQRAKEGTALFRRRVEGDK